MQNLPKGPIKMIKMNKSFYQMNSDTFYENLEINKSKGINIKQYFPTILCLFCGKYLVINEDNGNLVKETLQFLELITNI